MKRNNIFNIITAVLAAVLMITGGSCTKPTLGPVHYETRLAFFSSQLSTANLSMEFNGEMSKDTLTPGTWYYKTFNLSADDAAKGKSMRFKFYKTGTTEVVVDSTVTMKRTTEQQYSLIYNSDLGLTGFLNGTGVPADSIRVRFTYTDATIGKKHPALQFDFGMSYNDPPFYDPNDFYLTGPVIHDGGLASPDLMIPYYKKDNVTPAYYYIRLKDPTTGKFLEWYTGFDFFDTALHDLDKQSYLFINFRLVDFPDGGPDCYVLEASTLKL